MNILITVAVTFFAGMGAGLGTGFAGMSAAAVISPMLITFLGIEPYTAVGIALASDVLASAVSAYTYGKSKNLDIKNGLIMMASVLAFTVLGSFLASLLPSAAMGNFSVFMTFLLGIKFIVRPVMTTKEAMMSVSAKARRSIGGLRNRDRTDLRLRRCRRRHDDASDPDLGARVRAENRRRNKRVHHDLHCPHGRDLPLCDRRHTRYNGACPVHRVYVHMGKDRRRIRKPRGAENA
jgi:hypothetical protein